ncbi:WD40 repeat-like protein [Atractiella rhizophila]|nr:WD40 repeat-like protein [Atractiella rhizophila]
MTSLISATTWIKRGVAERNPKRASLCEEDVRKVSRFTRLPSLGENEELGWEDASSSSSINDDNDAMDVEEERATQDPDDLSAFNLERYDAEVGGAAIFSNSARLAVYQDSADDPYITLKTTDEDLEREELEILPADNLLVVAKTQDEVSLLEIYVYDSDVQNPSVYAHHDILLPAMPLCLEWLDFSGERPESGNFVAVGTLDPEIEIWCLDTLDAVCPTNILGEPKDLVAEYKPSKKNKRTKKRSTSSQNPGFHSDSILGLAWNRSHRNLLASASADATIKLWDLSLPAGSVALRSFDNIHSDKVQAVQWNLTQPTALLSGSYDRTVKAFDTRAVNAAVGVTLNSDVECVRWDCWDLYNFMVSQESGIVQCFDSRMLTDQMSSKPVWTLAAHDGAASALDINPFLRGCLVTGGTDKMVKLWSYGRTHDKDSISLVAGHDFGVGKVFSATFCPDDATTIAFAGSQATFQIWDAFSAMSKVFDLSEFSKQEPMQPLIGITDENEID